MAPVATQGATMVEVAKHTAKEDCWVVVDNRVLNLTTFLGDHPGGELAIMTFAGKDASEEFNMVHPPGVIDKYLEPHHHVGPVLSGEPAPEPPKKEEPKPLPPTEPVAPPAKKPDLQQPLLPQAPPREMVEEEGGWCGTLFHLIWAFMAEIFGTIFFTGNFVLNGDRKGLTRSAFFLIMFMVIHAVGNLHLFLGPDDFCGYGYFYVRLYWTGFGFDANIVEEYVAICALLHVIVALKRTWDISINYPINSGKMNLAFSGIWLFVFMSIHLQQFRFGATTPYEVRPPPYLINPMGIVPGSGHFLNLFWTDDVNVPKVAVRDIYKLEFDIFQDLTTVVFYELSVIAFLLHYMWGWAKVVPSSQLNIPKMHHGKVILIGNVIGFFVAACYFSFPIYCYLVAPSEGVYGKI